MTGGRASAASRARLPAVLIWQQPHPWAHTHQFFLKNSKLSHAPKSIEPFPCSKEDSSCITDKRHEGYGAMPAAARRSSMMIEAEPHHRGSSYRLPGAHALASAGSSRWQRDSTAGSCQPGHGRQLGHSSQPAAASAAKLAAGDAWSMHVRTHLSTRLYALSFQFRTALQITLSAPSPNCTRPPILTPAAGG